MRTFLVIDLFNKMPDTCFNFYDVIIVIEMNFFFLERSDESFGNLSVLPRTPSASYGNLNTVLFEP